MAQKNILSDINLFQVSEGRNEFKKKKYLLSVQVVFIILILYNSKQF